MKFKKDKIKKFIKKNVEWIIVFLCMIYFLQITENVFQKDIMIKDIIGYKIISKFMSNYITPIAKFITQFGSAIVLFSIATALFIIIKNKKIGLCIYLNLGIVGILNHILKNIVQRPRPTECRLIDESGYSFPSGHSMASAAFYGFLIYLLYKKVKNKKLRNTLIVLLFLLIFLIGISRIYLGVHYTSDVLAGFLVSLSYLMIYTNLVDEFIETNNISNPIDSNENKNQ